jgi:hypothetical protein
MGREDERVGEGELNGGKEGWNLYSSTIGRKGPGESAAEGNRLVD